METIFTLPYPEFLVAKELIRNFKKKDGYSVSIPISRQQKGFDLLIYNQKTKRALTVQVKSSRTWEGSPPKRKVKNERFKHYTWFNSFQVEKGCADYFILLGSYAEPPAGKKLDRTRDAEKWYSQILLCLDEEEMIGLMSGLTTRSGEKKDSKFGFGFNDQRRVVLTRGATRLRDISEFLFSKRVAQMKRALVE